MDIKCAACLQSFTMNCKISTTFCAHSFHSLFISKKLKIENKCPECQKPCTEKQMIQICFSTSKEQRLGLQRTNDIMASESVCHWAALNGETETYKHLIFGVIENRSPKSVNGSTPLHYAASAGHSEMCRIAMSMMKVKDPKDEDGNTPLHWAALGGFSNTLEILMFEVDEKNPRNNEGYTPLHFAAENGNLDMVELIMTYVPDVLHRMVQGKNPQPLHFVVQNGHLEILNRIIRHLELYQLILQT